MKQNNRCKGFTIIELMIVIAIITILAIVLIPKGGVAKDKAKNVGKVVDRNTLQGYIDYKWNSILDNCNGNKSLADKKLLAYLVDDVELMRIVSPTNKKIRGIYDKILADGTVSDNYINVVNSTSNDVFMCKDRLYIKDGKVLEGNLIAMSKEERIEDYGKGLKRLLYEMAHCGATGSGAYRDYCRVFRRVRDNPEKYGDITVNPIDAKKSGKDNIVYYDEYDDDGVSREIGVLTLKGRTGEVCIGLGDTYTYILDTYGEHYERLEKAIEKLKNYKK